MLDLSGHDSFAAALAQELPAAIADVDELWGTEWPHAVLVVATRSDADFVGLGGRPGADIAAISVGQRVVFAPDAGDRLTDSTRGAVLRHEITHVATRAATPPGAPLWLVEGFADYAGYRESGLPFDRIAPTLARAPLPVALPGDDAFADPADSVLAYEKAWAACAFIAETFGEPALAGFYRSPGDTVLGLSPTEFGMRWNDWITARRTSG